MKNMSDYYFQNYFFWQDLLANENKNQEAIENEKMKLNKFMEVSCLHILHIETSQWIRRAVAQSRLLSKHFLTAGKR